MHQMVHFDQCEYLEVFLSFICLCKRLDFKMWNVVGRHEQGTTRTNNAIEAFNDKFSSLLSCHHSSVWTLIKSMKP